MSDELLVCQQDRAVGGSRKYSVLDMLNCFRIAGLLHADEDLREVLGLACQVCLAPSLAAEAVAFIQGKSGETMKVPSKAALSRCRGRVDVAWMLHTRKRLDSLIQNGLKVFVQTDATWQGGLEYQCTLAHFVAFDALLPLHEDRP